jgi:competence protein ComEA
VPDLSRAQVLVYGAIAVALLLVGARWVKAADGEEGGEGAAAVSSGQDLGGRDSLAVERGGGDLLVHVAGAVREPGVYRLPAGSRVTDAVERAGGPTGNASADAINLAAPLADGQQVQVPAAAGPPGTAPGGATEASGPISLGSATADDLDAIEGIGPVTAAAILEFRDERGGIASVDELDQISGIGPATMEALRGALQP